MMEIKLKLLIALIAFIFLFQGFKNENKALNESDQNNYTLDKSLALKVQYYEFDTLDLSLDMD